MPYVLDRMMFIHIPKTGGHSVWQVMKEHGGFRTKDEWGANFTHHMSGHGARQSLGGKYSWYQKVALVRNPWDRAVSLYFGRNKIKEHSPEGFAKYMRRFSSLNKMRFNPYYLQTRMLTPDTLIFKLDEIEKLYGWMEANLEITIKDRPFIKTGLNRRAERQDYQHYFTPVLRETIMVKHALDIDRFGWKF